MRTKKRNSSVGGDLRTEYDLSTLGRGVRGKYYSRAVAGTNLVLLEPDVAASFPDSRAVNEALRAQMRRSKVKRARGSRRKKIESKTVATVQRRRTKKSRAARS
jgi:hypothetical protein